MAGEEGTSSIPCHLSETRENWMHEMDVRQSQVDVLQARLQEMKTCIHESEEDARKEIKVLWRRVKTAATVLTYLKSKARVLAVPDLAYEACGIRRSDGEEGLIDRDGIPLSSWSTTVNLDLSSDGPGEDSWTRIDCDEPYIDELLKSVNTVSEVMETLLKRAVIAETETLVEKEKVSLGREEIRRKAVQIETMSVKLEEMEQFALGTNCILSDMKQRVEDLVEETSKQRQRAADNELELCRVKRDFESLKSYVNSLISVRETLLSSEKQFQTIERLFERLVAKTSQLESEKSQKEAEVNKLVEENVRLTALLDKKEAQLLAMNEQFKVMALSSSHM